MNKKAKIAVLLCIIGLAIGFAAVTAVLYINGDTKVVSNTGDFDIYFSKAVENGKEDNSLIKDKTHIVFVAEFNHVGEQYVLDYTITNGSGNYDALFELKYTGASTDTFSIVNNIDTTRPLKAMETRKGRIVIKQIKGVTVETKYLISYELVAHAKERDTLGKNPIVEEEVDYLKVAEPYNVSDVVIEDATDPDSLKNATYIGKTYLGHALDRTKVEKVTFLNTATVPKNAVTSWDVSEKSNGRIMAYTLDEDKNNMLELYIGQNGGVIANPDSTSLFIFFDHVKEWVGLENLDTSYVKTMEDMFAYCRSVESLDLRTFNTSKVENFITMFSYCLSLKNLDITSFNTTNAKDMSGLFNYCDKLESLDLHNFNTSNVTNMAMTFNCCFSLTSLDLTSFDTSKVTNMYGMFADCRKMVGINLISFNTSHVTDMFGMFQNCTNLESLDVSHFDMSNVTNIGNMFVQCRKLTTTITIRGTNCTSYMDSFLDAATEEGTKITVNYTANASSLVDQMIATKANDSNVIKGSQVV